MDPNWFDRWTRIASQSPSRRALLRLAVGTVLAGGPGLTGAGSDAKHHKPPSGCPAGQPLCCPPDQPACQVGDPGAYCGCGACDPDKFCGLVCCDGVCVDVLQDNQHCGGCNGPKKRRKCDQDEICTNGKCEQCPHGLVRCARPDDPSHLYCADLSNDPLNCGLCGTVCPTGQVCVPAAGGRGICRACEATTGVRQGEQCCAPPFPACGPDFCCPAENGVCCASDGCCPAGYVCQADGVSCCLPGKYVCPDRSACCPNGTTCIGGGLCASEQAARGRPATRGEPPLAAHRRRR